MKLKLYMTATAALYVPTNGESFALVEVLRKVAHTDGLYTGDRLADKAVSMLEYMMREAKVTAEDSAEVTKSKLWDYYLQSLAQVENKVRDKINGMLAERNEVRLQPVIWPENQKFPIQVNYTLDPGRFACIAYDELGELGEGEKKWVLFFVTLSANCRSQKVIGSFTMSNGQFAETKFREFLPALLDWTVGSQG